MWEISDMHIKEHVRVIGPERRRKVETDNTARVKNLKRGLFKINKYKKMKKKMLKENNWDEHKINVCVQGLVARSLQSVIWPWDNMDRPVSPPEPSGPHPYHIQSPEEPRQRAALGESSLVSFSHAASLPRRGVEKLPLPVSLVSIHLWGALAPSISTALQASEGWDGRIEGCGGRSDWQCW